jgi:hypothetical protein
VKHSLIPLERIEQRILLIRGHRVMLDSDLAKLYGVETRVLNQAIKRNIKRFPPEFMFQLTKEEMENWKSQIVMSKSIKMGLRRQPFAFTEHGVAMLSSVLNSDRAIEVNIAIIKTFVRLREMIVSNKLLASKLAHLKTRLKIKGVILRHFLLPFISLWNHLLHHQNERLDFTLSFSPSDETSEKLPSGH